MLKLCFMFMTLISLTLSAQADPYRLVIGDRIVVSADFLVEPKPATIDLDGNIRLAGIGSLTATGLTLDEVQADISKKMSLEGFNGAPLVLVEISQYAPVLVSGIVERSGRYEFLPGMDVRAAIAMAGGYSADFAERPNADVQAVNARRHAAIAGEAIAKAVAEVAGFEAALHSLDALPVVSDAQRYLVPTDLRDSLDAQVAAQVVQLTAQRNASAALVASWDSDIADFKEQTVLLDQRITLKDEVVTSLTRELADLETLRDQGLTTSSRFAVQRQRLADDREELLSLETAKISARRAATFAARNRDRYLAEQRAAQLDGLQQARADLDAGQRDYRFALEELALVSADALPDESPRLEVSFTIRGPRSKRFGDALVDLDTPLLPGDIIVVEIANSL